MSNQGKFRKNEQGTQSPLSIFTILIILENFSSKVIFFGDFPSQIQAKKIQRAVMI